MRMLLILFVISWTVMGGVSGLDCQAYKALLEESAKKQNFRETLNHLEVVQKETPEDYCVSYAIGWLYYSLRDYEKARAFYEKTIALAHQAKDIAEEAEARVKLAILYLYCGIPDKALKCLSEFP